MIEPGARNPLRPRWSSGGAAEGKQVQAKLEGDSAGWGAREGGTCFSPLLQRSRATPAYGAVHVLLPVPGYGRVWTTLDKMGTAIREIVNVLSR